jgi:hypothetical protein
MPELVNISVGSLAGTSGLEATTVCPFDSKNFRKVVRISEAFIRFFLGWLGWLGEPAIIGKDRSA